MGKFYESGKLDQVMPSGHLAHALPRTNFHPQAAPQVNAVVPHADAVAKTMAIVQALRGSGGLSAPSSGLRGQSKIVTNPGSLPRTVGPTLAGKIRS